MIAAVLFDLDDTLFAQGAWLDGAWRAVAAAGARLGLAERPLQRALMAIAAEGSDRGGIIDRALAAVGASDAPITPLLEAFRAYRGTVFPFPGVVTGLARLRRRVPIALVSDGDPSIQAAKLDALGLAGAFDAVVWSDAIGRAFRKPDPAPFVRALAMLDVAAESSVFVGDRPEKDGLGAQRVGMRYVRVLRGEFRRAPDLTTPWRTRRDTGAAIEMLIAATSAASANGSSREAG